MSSDNFYIIRRHPKGGFAAVMGFASDIDDQGNEITPDVPASAQSFSTLSDALNWAINEYSEYGVSVHEECTESRSQLRRINIVLEKGI